MGWLDRINAKKEEDKLPQRLRDKTPEQIAKELEDADKLKTEHELLKAQAAEYDGKVTEIQTEFEKVKTQLATAEANRNKPPDKKDEKIEATPENMLENPKGVLDARLAPLEATTIRNGASMSRMLAQQQLDGADMASGGKDMNGRLFRAWASEIDAEARKYSPVQLMTPEAWLGIFWYLKGTHADELRDPEVRKKKYTFLEPAATQVTPPGEPKKEGAEGLTDQEKHVADKMGVSYENYAKRKKAMVMVNV
jgi:hypothetical protein